MAIRTRDRDTDTVPVFDQDYRPPPWRERLVPKTVLGISMLILATAIGSAFSGTILYAYYDYRLSSNEDRIESFTGNFDQRFQTALDTIAAERETAKAEVRKELEPIKKLTASSETLEELVADASRGRSTAPSDVDVVDPYRREPDVHHQVADEIAAAVDIVASRLSELPMRGHALRQS